MRTKLGILSNVYYISINNNFLQFTFWKNTYMVMEINLVLSFVSSISKPIESSCIDFVSFVGEDNS